MESARGNYSGAATYAGEASRLEGEMPFAFGPPFIDWPSAELHAEMLLKAHRYSEAAAAFETQLKRARLRTRSLMGLAQAQKLLSRSGIHAEQTQTDLAERGQLRQD